MFSSSRVCLQSSLKRKKKQINKQNILFNVQFGKKKKKVGKEMRT